MDSSQRAENKTNKMKLTVKHSSRHRRLMRRRRILSLCFYASDSHKLLQRLFINFVSIGCGNILPPTRFEDPAIPPVELFICVSEEDFCPLPDPSAATCQVHDCPGRLRLEVYLDETQRLLLLSQFGGRPSAMCCRAAGLLLLFGKVQRRVSPAPAGGASHPYSFHPI